MVRGKAVYVVKSTLKPREQVTVFRLRTGHNRFKYHLYSKLRIGYTEQCPCGTGSQTTEHLMQSCHLTNEKKKKKKKKLRSGPGREGRGGSKDIWSSGTVLTLHFILGFRCQRPSSPPSDHVWARRSRAMFRGDSDVVTQMRLVILHRGVCLVSVVLAVKLFLSVRCFSSLWWSASP